MSRINCQAWKIFSFFPLVLDLWTAASFVCTHKIQAAPYSHQGKGTSDECSYSDKIDNKYSCSTTSNAVQLSNTTNIASQVAGSMTVNATGAHQQMNALQSGSQSAALNAAANTQTIGASTQLGIGAGNTIFASYLFQKAYQHDQAAKQISQETSADATASLNVVKVDGGNALETDLSNARHMSPGNETAGTVSANRQGIQSQIIQNYKLNEDSGVTLEKVDPSLLTTGVPQDTDLFNERKEKREKEGDRHKNAVAYAIEDVGRDSAGEQKRISSTSMLNGMMLMMTGSQQLISGGTNLAAAQELKKVAAALSTQKPTLSVIAPPTLSPPSNPQTALTPNTISGSGLNPDPSTSSDSSTTQDPPPDLGQPFNPIPINSGVPTGPMPGKLNENSSPPGAGGGMSGLGGGASTAEDKSSQEDPQARLVTNEKGPSYESGGTFMGARSGAGKGADGGPDLNSLLEKFLPKKDDPSLFQNSILQFGKSTGPDQPLSLLDKNVNIFERVHETYQDENKQGKI